MARHPVMKASEVLKRYAAAERNFRGVNLRGQSFKGQNLSGADFSKADLRSTNFTEATLIGTNFAGAKCGLQKRWAAILTILSWLLASLSGLFSLFINFAVSLIFYSSPIFPSRLETQIVGLISFIILIIFLVVTVRLGVFTAVGLVAIVGAVAFVISFVGARAETGVDAGVGGAVFAGVSGSLLGGVVIVIGAVAFAGGVNVERTFAFAGIFAVTIAFTILVRGTVAIAGASVGVGVEMYIAWRAMKGDPRDAWIRSFAVAFAAIGGTSFRDAKLTDAHFTGARLKSTDFRNATLTRVRWYGAKMLDRVRPENTYLENTQLRQWLIGEGKEKNFDRQDLRGVNLQGANLTNASFIDTDLSQADLQGATLFEAKLVQTNLDKANLSNTDLTAAYIEDWGITRNTRFDGVKGDYVYQKLPTKYDRDPNRMPPSQQGNFGENDLYIFITSVLDTLDLYHRQNINAGVALTVLKGLTKDYPVQFELAAIEKRGDNQYVMKLKVFGQSSYFQIQREYYDRYEQTLPLYDPKMLMPNSDNIVAKIIKTVEENPGTHVENLHNRGIVITGGEVDMSGDRNIEIKKGNYNEKIEGNYYEQKGNFGIGHMSGGEIKGNAKVAGVINEAQERNLAEAAAEIQALIKQLEQDNPTNTTTEQMVVATKAIEQIESNPTWKQKAISAFKQGSLKAIETHPVGAFVVGAIKGWIEPQAK